MALGSVNEQFLCCDGCLSVDRQLKPVENGSILIQILFDEKDFIKLNMMVCWECASMLTKILMFRRRVQRAQGVLQHVSVNGKNITLSDSLSNLCMEINTDVVDISYEKESRYLVENIDDIKENDTDHQNEEYESENHFDAEKLQNDSGTDRIKTEYESRTNNESPRSDEKSKRKYERKVEVIRENFTKLETAKYFRKVIVSEDEVMKVLEKEKKNYVYIKRPFKCEMCVCSFVTEQAYKKHNEQKHSKENGSYTCNLCETHLPSKRHMHEHWKSHIRLYECTLCGYTCLHKNMQKIHLRISHSRQYKCKMCSSLFRSRKDFSDHYKELHFKLICDHCGKKFSMRRSIENHIKRNHGSRDCMLCHRHYKTYHSLENHYRMRHPFMISKNLKNEDSYCVECDKQFDSVYKYKNHLRTSVRHTPPKKISVPCPDCGKVFSKKTYMKNHHKLAHVKQSEHHCPICDKYFITAFSLRQHKQTVHDKITVPRDKICNVCGRAFKANRNLIYHMRTHTGERPFRCEYCAASFAQKIAMTSHIKTVHFKNKIINQCLSSFLNTNQ